MTAQTLRDAAKVLRERAEAATSGTWVHNPINGIHTVIGSCIATTHRHVEDSRRADAAYIATVHPAVGLLLADWLDDAAAWEKTPNTVNHDMRAHDIARAILRETA